MNAFPSKRNTAVPNIRGKPEKSKYFTSGETPVSSILARLSVVTITIVIIVTINERRLTIESCLPFKR
jgi:hypothetical protein